MKRKLLVDTETREEPQLKVIIRVLENNLPVADEESFSFELARKNLKILERYYEQYRLEEDRRKLDLEENEMELIYS